MMLAKGEYGNYLSLCLCTLMQVFLIILVVERKENDASLSRVSIITLGPKQSQQKAK